MKLNKTSLLYGGLGGGILLAMVTMIATQKPQSGLYWARQEEARQVAPLRADAERSLDQAWVMAQELAEGDGPGGLEVFQSEKGQRGLHGDKASISIAQNVISKSSQIPGESLKPHKDGILGGENGSSLIFPTKEALAYAWFHSKDALGREPEILTRERHLKKEIVKAWLLFLGSGASVMGFAFKIRKQQDKEHPKPEEEVEEP